MPKEKKDYLLRAGSGKLELVTVLCSNLRPLIEPSLELQLSFLKEHIGIKSFAAAYQ